MVYFPEVSALAFFLSENPSDSPQLRQPAWILGARPVGSGLDGTCRFDSPVIPNSAMPMRSDLKSIELAGMSFNISSSRPFVAFMSESQGFIPDAKGLAAARLNKEVLQRDVDPGSKFAFGKQVRAWYRSIALDSYAAEVQPILRSLVKSIGTGPWLAGLWFGDSQLGLLASWLGQAAAAKSWGALPMDYYIYSSFTENPGNQCFVHSSESCRACLQACVKEPLTEASYWLPNSAYMGSTNPCVLGGEQSCGEHGIEHLVAAYEGKSAATLWKDIERSIRLSSSGSNQVERTVFDLLLH